MRKWFVFFMIQMLITPSAFSQVAKIVDMHGNVQVRLQTQQTSPEPWRRPRLDMYLNEDAEIKTGKNSDCTIAFDEDLENVLTIKENSSVTIKSISPGEVYLPKGRVFSLIEDLAKIQAFQVRTPTAIAGVRGTGDSVETDNQNTTVKCFEGVTGVEGTGSGSPGEEKELSGGSGVTIGSDGSMGAPFELGDEDYNEWDDYRYYIDGLREDLVEGSDSDDPFQQLKNEQRDNSLDDLFEELRNDNKEDEGSGYRSVGAEN